MKYTTANVTQLKNRKGKPWMARLKYKDITTGKWKETTKILKDATGKRDAQKKANSWLSEMNAAAANSPTMESDKTIEEVFTSFLDYQLSTGQIEKSTYYGQHGMLKNHIIPLIGNYSFYTFDRTAAAAWLTKLNEKGLNQNTIKQNYRLAKKVYNYYYNLGELTKNPFQGIPAPKAEGFKVTHLNQEQMDDFLSAVYANYEPEDAMYAGFLLAFYAGLRTGEICGLRWRNIDFTTGTISIDSAIGVGEEGAYTKQPKTRTSTRTFPIVPQLLDALEARRRCINPKRNWFVCGDKTEYMKPDNFYYKFKTLAEEFELKDVYGHRLSPHMLRHNLGAIGIRSGMDIASLSMMFGHASRAMTLDIYGDANKDAMKLAASKLSEKFDDDSKAFKRSELESIEEE